MKALYGFIYCSVHPNVTFGKKFFTNNIYICLIFHVDLQVSVRADTIVR
jgi:hypothetical protein